MNLNLKEKAYKCTNENEVYSLSGTVKYTEKSFKLFSGHTKKKNVDKTKTQYTLFRYNADSDVPFINYAYLNPTEEEKETIRLFIESTYNEISKEI